MFQKNSIKIALIVGIVVIVSLVLWNHYSISHFTVMNRTTDPFISQAVQSDQVLGRLSHSITLNETMPEKAEKILIYKNVPVLYTRQDILLLAQKFNITPIGRIKEVEEGSSVASDDGKIQAVLHNSGIR